MAKFTVRVELHYTDDYETLHEAMESEGFSRNIRAPDGSYYHLPTAEYNLDGPYTKGDALKMAKLAATKTGKRFAVLVTESNGRLWADLDPV